MTETGNELIAMSLEDRVRCAIGKDRDALETLVRVLQGELLRLGLGQVVQSGRRGGRDPVIGRILSLEHKHHVTGRRTGCLVYLQQSPVFLQPVEIIVEESGWSPPENRRLSNCELNSRKPNCSAVSNRPAANGIPRCESGKFTMTRRWRLVSRSGL
jgi:hypothetical protein